MDNKTESEEVKSESQTNSTKTSKFLSHPFWAVFSILASITTIIGFLLSIHFYYQSKEYPELTFMVHPIKAVLLQKGQTSKLTASFEDRLLESDVTTAQVAIWNKGKKSIKQDSILTDNKSIKITSNDNTPILEAIIRKSSREEVQCSINTEQISNGILYVTWKILERDDGCIIQLIYAGNANVTFNASGSIEGQRGIEIFVPDRQIKSAEEQFENEGVGNGSILGIILGLATIVLYSSILILLFRKGKSIVLKKSPIPLAGAYCVLIIMIILGLSVFGYSLYDFLYPNINYPQFGFNT